MQECETCGVVVRDSPRTTPPNSAPRRAARRANAQEDLGPLPRGSGGRLEEAADGGESLRVGEGEY